MSLFGETKKPFTYDILREGEETIVLIDLEQYQHIPSLEDDEVCMSRTMDILAEAGIVTKIVYVQKRNYEYDYSQASMVQEIAKLYSQLTKKRDVLGYDTLLADPKCSKWASHWYNSIQTITADLLKRDPIGAYVELKRTVREERIKIDRSIDPVYAECAKKYIYVLQYLMMLMEKTKLISSVKSYLPGFKLNDRAIYRRVFTPDIRPDFMFTKLMSSFPPEGEEIDNYQLDKNTDVTIFELPDNVQYLYHLLPPEFKLTEEKYEILDTARKIMAEHKPTRQEFIDPERMRQVFYNIGSDLIEELVNYRNLKLLSTEIDEMTKILVRYTVGFGLIEVLLQDEKIQDITINSPMGETPMFIVHQDYSDCRTNIVPTTPEAESWASKLRLVSGRPLDEANPILDTELTIPGANARIAVVAPPLNPSGLAFAFRRHRDKPWTLPLFMKNKMLNPLAAGIMSFLIDGSRSMLIAGTRSAGKTSLLGAVLVELMRKYRVITIEDSVAGDSSIIIQRNGNIERTTIGNLIDELINKYGQWYNLTEHEVTGNPENIKVFAMDKQGKIKLSPVSKFIRHKVKKPVYKIKTRTGRVIKVTGDHSLFGLDSNSQTIQVKVNALKKGSNILVSPELNFFKNVHGTWNLVNDNQKLTSALKEVDFGNSVQLAVNGLTDNLIMSADLYAFLDEVTTIEIIENYKGFVYDISVPECESFVCENIVAHNTMELPTNSLRKLGYNIQSMKVAAALSKGSSEVPADEGIRTTLRMGDSALIIGEIRSKEALALYEAMRIGALANVVAGTIHGDSPYGVFDRVVNDLQVPRTSFKATDIVIVANPIRSADGLHRWRRVTQITEVRKHWETDPLTENGFVDLMKYDSKKDDLMTSDELMNGDSEILKAIAGNVKEWAGNWDAVWDNITLRAKTKQTLLEFSEKANNPDLLEAEFVIQCNDQFHKISEKIREEVGSLDSKRIFFDWNEWLKRHVKRMDFHRQL